MSVKAYHIMAVVLVSLMTNVGWSAERRLRTGREYMLLLSQRTETPYESLLSVFFQLAGAMPLNSSPDNVTKALPAYTKIAAAACDEIGLFPEVYSAPDLLFSMILDRDPTEQEKDSFVRDEDGSLHVFATCLKLALHPELLFREEK